MDNYNNTNQKKNRRGRPQKYSTDDERRQAKLNQIRRYQKENPEKRHMEVEYFGYNKKDLIMEEDKEKFKEDITSFLKFKACFNYLYKKYPQIMEEIICDKNNLLI